jgi:hypothetical protein
MISWRRGLLLVFLSGALLELGLLDVGRPAIRGRANALSSWFRGSSADFAAHVDTLGVAGAILIANLPRRADRRANMTELAHRIGATFAFVDAVDAHGPEVAHILQHVRALRESGAEYPPLGAFTWPVHSPPLDWTGPLAPGAYVNESMRARTMRRQGPLGTTLQTGRV